MKIDDNELILIKNILKDSYEEATGRNGLIEFTKEIRGENNNLSGKYSLKTNRVNRMFSLYGWEESRHASGHRKLIHKITKVVIEYSNHQQQVDPGAAESILNSVQHHLNILCNDIFKYQSNNWKKEPNFVTAAKELYVSYHQK